MTKYPYESIAAAVKEFCKNPYWRGLYEQAPRRAKKVLALQFWASENDADSDECEEEYDDLLESAKRALKVEDLEYLVANAGTGGAASMAVKKYAERLAAIRERAALRGV